jgi:hypothetical protein
MTSSLIRCVLICAVLAACGDQPSKNTKTPSLHEVLPVLPLPPDPNVVSRAGGPDVLQLTVRSPASSEVVEAYYRQTLKTGGWHLVSDAKDAAGAVVFLAHQQGPPLWVRIRKAENGEGSIVELTGAIVPKHDTAAAARGKPTPTRDSALTAPRKPAS